MKPQIKLKLFLFFAVAMFLAKPFIGFAQFNRQHPPVHVNMFVLQKSFSKRILQYRDGSMTVMAAIQKKLAHPVISLRLRLSFLWLLLFPVFFRGRKDTAYHYIRRLILQKTLLPPIYLLNRQIIV